jgi:hypothetical protein
VSRLDVLLSSDSPDWCTPPEVLEPVRTFAPIGFDPFSNAGSIVGAAVDVRPPADSLTMPWPVGGGLVWCNPPYGRELAACAAKIAAQARRGCEILTLVPARTDTAWFETLAAPLWCAWRGRVQFLEQEHAWRVRLRRAALRAGKPPPDETMEPKRRVGSLVGNDPAPFPVALCYHGPRPEAFAAHFAVFGQIYRRCDVAPLSLPRKGVTGRRPSLRVPLDRVAALLAQGLSVREMAQACGVKKHQIEAALRELRVRAASKPLSENADVFGHSADVPPGGAFPPVPGAGLSENAAVLGQSPPVQIEESSQPPDPLLSLLLSIADGSRPIEDVDPALWPALNRDFLAVRALVPGPPGRKRTAVAHIQITEFGLRRIGRLPARRPAAAAVAACPSTAAPVFGQCPGTNAGAPGTAGGSLHVGA